MELTADQLHGQEQVYIRVENAMYEMRDQLQAKIAGLSPVIEPPPANAQAVHVEFNTFNENTWGKFDGDVSRWLSFRDRFSAAVHQIGSNRFLSFNIC